MPPLKVKTWTLNGETVLDVTLAGGVQKLLPRPFDPYFFAPYEVSRGSVEKVRKKLLSTLKETDLWHVSFKNTRTLIRCRVNGGIEDTVPYDQRVAINRGFKFAGKVPTHEAFDLEMESKKGFFPNPEYDRITAIAYAGENGYEKCKLLNDVPEYEIIHWFLDTIQRRNPDIPETYFGSFADWDWLIKRAHANNIALSVGRNGSEPYTKIRTFKVGKKVGEDRIIDINGRVHFDVWKEVSIDPALSGIKNRKLKTVAKWFGIPVIEVDRSQMDKLSPQELHDYCMSDARATRELAKIYLRNMYALGEMLEIPFNMVTERSPSHPSNYIYMREFGKRDIVADKSNFERYPEFFAEGRKAYQGANVNLYNPGVYREKEGQFIRHADFKSMYPTIMHVHNYSPETLLSVKINRKLTMKEWVRYDGNLIHVYDKNIGLITIEIDQSHDSVTRTKINEFMTDRDKIKAKIKIADSPELQSQQWGIKVVMNAIYGYHGMRFARCGAVPISAHVTGHGRFWIDKGTDFLLANALPLERDTDGIYYIGENYTQEINDIIIGLIPDYYNKKYVRVDENIYPDGIFYDEKGYVLRKKSGKLVFHGSGLKGRHIPKVCDLAVERIALAILDNENVVTELNDIGRGLRDLSQEHFLMTAQLKKHPDDYSDKTQYGKIIQRLKNNNIPFRWGDEIQYVKTIDRSYLPLGVSGQINLDWNYYRGRIADIVERLLRISHGYNVKQIKAALAGGKITKSPKYEETKLA